MKLSGRWLSVLWISVTLLWPQMQAASSPITLRCQADLQASHKTCPSSAARNDLSLPGSKCEETSDGERVHFPDCFCDTAISISIAPLWVVLSSATLQEPSAVVPQRLSRPANRGPPAQA